MLEEKDKQEIATLVAETIKQTGLLEVNRRFTPGGEGDEGGEGDPKIIPGDSPEDKIMKDPKGGFRDIAEFACAIAGKGSKWYGQTHFEKLKDYSNAVIKTAGLMEEGDQSQGGYLVPEEFRAQLLITPVEAVVVKPRATVVPMQANRIGMPAVVDATHANSLYGGVRAYRTGEAAQKTGSKPELSRVYLTLHKLTGLVTVTDELLEDSPISLVPLLSQMFNTTIAFEEDDDYLVGNGVNRPLGAFNTGNPSLVAVAPEAGQPAGTILAENLIKMWSRLHPASMRNAVWVANGETFPQLATMTIAVGTGGVPVWMPAQGLAGSPNGTLFGKPLLLCEKMQALGTQGDIGLADFSQYLIAQKAGGGVKTASSIHLKFDYDETVFRFVLRYDGRPWWLSDLTPRRGSATLSPFVVIEAR